MTTPERLRQRQLLEGVILIVIGILMLVQAWYFTNESSQSRQCMENNFIALSHALEARANLDGRIADATVRVNLAELEAKSEKDFLSRLNDYRREMDAIERVRENNPVPPYPVGECEG